MNYVPGSYVASSREPAVADMAGIESRLAGVDLNLLIALEALLIHQNVTLAARKIGQTQPAMSRALARLRDLLDDDLLVRGSNGLQLTVRGAHLARRLPIAMAQVRDVCHLRETESPVALSVNEYMSPLLLPQLMDNRPHGNTPLLIGTHGSSRQALEQLETRSADFVLGAGLPVAAGIASLPVYSDDFVSLVGPGIAADAVGLRDLDHARISEDVFPQVSAALATARVDPARFVDVPDIVSAALMAGQGRLALTVPRSIAKWLQLTTDLQELAPLVAISGYELRIGWLNRTLQPSHQSLVERLVRFTHQALEGTGSRHEQRAIHA